jgi:cytochrome oxidase Cu insertion factor (SCO1/SenC/PrrC family)
LKGVVLAGVFAAVLMGADVPRPAPEFTVRMMDGKDIVLSRQRGKVVCLMFILTTCPHCQKLVGTMSKLQPELGPKGLLTVAGATQDMPTLYLPDFIRDFKPAFPVGFVDRNLAMQFMQHDPKYIFYNPCVTLIDRKGVIRGQYPGGDPIFDGDQEANLRAKIEPLLKEK